MPDLTFLVALFFLFHRDLGNDICLSYICTVKLNSRKLFIARRDLEESVLKLESMTTSGPEQHGPPLATDRKAESMASMGDGSHNRLLSNPLQTWRDVPSLKLLNLM
jgi:hypothetical protein